MAVCGGGNAEICVKEFGDMGEDNYDNIKPLLKEIAANNDVPESFFYLLEDAYRDNHAAIPYIVVAKEDFYKIEKGLTDHLKDAAMMAMFGGSLKVKAPGVNPGKGASISSGNTKTPNTIEIAGVPERVRFRINIRTGDSPKDNRGGWLHVEDRHFSGKTNASQFTISKDELKILLQSKSVVSSPVVRTVNSKEGIRYVREVTVSGKPIGTDKLSGNQPTNIMTVMTDKYGNLVTTFPGKLP